MSTASTGSLRSGRTGRPRDPALDEAILSAALSLVARHGLDSLRMDDVARTAGVGVATIYRRWESKEDLVAATLARAMDHREDEDAHDVIAKLITGTDGPNAGFLPGILAAMRADPALDRLVRERFVEPDREALRAYVRDRVPAHVEPEEISWIADIALAVLMYRGVILREPLRATDGERVLETLDRLCAAVDS